MGDSFLPDPGQGGRAGQEAKPVSIKTTGVSDSFAPDTPPPSLPWYNRVGQAALDIARGSGAELASTIYHGGDILRRLTGAERIIGRPEIQAEMTPPPSLAGKLGAGATTVSEFMLPAGVVGKGVKAVEALAAGTRAARALPWAARVGGEAASAAGVEALRTGGDVESMKTAAALGAALPTFAGPAKGVLHYATDVLGKTTGAGGEAVRIAASRATAKLKDAMRSRTSELEIVRHLKDAVKQVRTTRASDYRAAISGLDPAIPVSNVTLPQLQQALDDYGVKITQSGLNFGGTRLAGPTASTDRQMIGDTVKQILTWRDRSPVGMDQLKQLVYDAAESADPRVAPFFYRLGGHLRDNLSRQVPGYEKMTKEYAVASELLGNINSELSASAANPGTTIRKLAYSLNQNNEYRKTLIESLDAVTGAGMKEELAGYSLRSFVPRGLMGSLAAGGVATAGAMGKIPGILPLALITSPRAVGEVMALISALRSVTPYMATTPMATGAGMAVLSPPPGKKPEPNK